MEQGSGVMDQINGFIHGDSFFHYHGLVLSLAWMIGAVVAILMRKVSVILHGVLFFVIDAATAFFIVGAMLRVYPYIQTKWDVWTPLKKGHFIGGAFFLVLLVIQHIGGVSTLLKGIKYNSTHRKLGFYVSNLGRIIALVGSIIGEAEQWVIYTNAAITIIVLIGSTYKVFFASSEKPVKASEAKQGASSPSRTKSPKRRD